MFDIWNVFQGGFWASPRPVIERIHGTYMVHSWMFWSRETGRKVALKVQPSCPRPLLWWMNLLISKAASARYILRFVSAWVQKWFDLNTDAGVLGGRCVLIRVFIHQKCEIEPFKHIRPMYSPEKKRTLDMTTIRIFGFYHVFLCFGFYFRILNPKEVIWSLAPSHVQSQDLFRESIPCVMT